MEWERTTADEFNDTMASDLDQNGASKAVSRKSGGAPLHLIKESLKRLREETGYGEPYKKGEKDDEETLRTDSGDNTPQNKPRRVDDIQGPPDIGLIHHNVG